MPRPLINSFNAGELSPTLDARVDIDKYRNGCRILENAIPKIQGGVYGRAGMVYMGEAKHPDKAVRLIPFTYDVATSFILEFGDGYIRFWSNGQQVESGGNPYEISSVYGVDDLFNIQFQQVNDVVYLVDGAHAPQKLTRLADDSWTIADVDWVWPAMQDENAAVSTVGTQTTTELIRQNTEEWPQAAARYENCGLAYEGTIDVSVSTKTVKIERWNGSAWVAHLTHTWTTSPPSGVSLGGELYVSPALSLPAVGYFAFRLTYSGPAWSAGAKVHMYTDPVGAIIAPHTYRYKRTILLDAMQPQASLTECTVTAGWQWRARVKFLGTMPTNNSVKVQYWTGAAWADVAGATITFSANKWVTYNGAIPGADTRYRLKWAGTTSTNGYSSWEVPTSNDPFLRIIPDMTSGDASPEPQVHGVMLLERVIPTAAGGDITLTLNGTTGTGVTMTASGDLFNAAHVGSYWQIAHRRDPEDTGGSFLEAKPTVATAATYYSVLGSTMTTTEANGTGLRVLGSWDFTTYGTWIGTVALQVRQADGTTWDTIRTYSSLGTTGDRNIIATGEAETEQFIRIKFVKTTAAAISNVRFLLEPRDARVYGLAKVTAYTSATVVTVTVIKDVWKTTATRLWSESSWNDYRGYPRAICVDNQRIVYGGTEHEPLTFWGSVVGDFENFFRSTLADSSYAFRIAATKGNSIVWMMHQGRFMIGTQGDEWLVEPGSNSDGVVTVNSVRITMQSSYGSGYVQPVAANDTMMFVERGRKRIREFVFQFDKQAFAAPDLTLLADHIFEDTKVKQMAFASVPDPVVWVVTQDNRLMSMTFERDQSVVGWSRHVTDGEVESVAVIYGDYADEVWLVVKRTIDGSEVKYLERLDPEKWTKLEAENIAGMIYVDSAIRVIQTSSTSVTGLSHLEGKTVSVLADGFVQLPKVVASGAIELDTAAEDIVVGLPYTVRVQPVKLELGMPDGTSQGRRFHACQSMLRFWLTGAAQYADTPDGHFYDVVFRTVNRPADELEPLYTGDKRIYLASRHRDSLDLTIRNTKPLPFGLLAIAPIVEASGQ